MPNPVRRLLSASILLSSLIAASAAASDATPLAIGDTFTLESKALSETRRINVYAAVGYEDPATLTLPVLYMPDGGIGEDFLHVAGLLQVSVANGTMRPFLLVGIENTERRRDMTGPTDNAEDRKIAPRVGGSDPFRAFIRDELKPAIAQRYRITGESAIVGESLAGLFVVETLLREPALFDTYVAFDPSLWWNDAELVGEAAALLAEHPEERDRLYVAVSSEPQLAELGARFAGELKKADAGRLDVQFVPMPAETHGTIYHPAALQAFRVLFKP